MTRPWEIDPEATFLRRLGKSAVELGDSRTTADCPDIWELSNGDVAVVGRDATALFADRMPPGVSVGHDERLVVVPGNMLRAAKPDIADV
ncbi:hypothetical protein [Nocardiopsis ansamitocini]|nr:hypothetical protein [Nocardiopsis ansamitocini]